MKSEDISRRSFLKRAAALSAAAAIPSFWIPSKANAMPGVPFVSANEKVRIAFIGIGNRGGEIAQELYKTGLCEVVALCDVDMGAPHTQKLISMFPKVPRFQDFRQMFDKMADKIDAVTVGVPDHAHFPITIEAMAHGKHVYVEKPMARTFQEIEVMMRAEKKFGVVTQMGNQGSSDEGTDLVCEWIWNGEIGDVTKVECATDRPIWPQGLNVPEKEDRIPKTLNWDLFTGPAKMNPYNEIYHPWNWRGWWDYGTGALGDMACHILHQPFRALKLLYPTKVEGSSTLLLNACAPQAQHVKLTFPARENMPKVAMPEVEVHWYDGGMMPDRPKGFPEGKQLMQSGGGLTIFHGTKDTLICGCYGQNPWLLSGRVPNAPKVCRRVPKAMNGGHEMDWVRACKESPSSRVMPKSDFSEAGPMNEMVAMGVLAIRLQGLNKTLEWDGANMRFTNIGDDETLRTVIKDGFKIHNGHPSFDKTWTDPVNAKAFAEELIKHNYREGWKLPDMPR